MVSPSPPAPHHLTIDQLLAVVHLPQQPTLSRTSLDQALASPRLPVRLLAAVVVARLGDTGPLDELLDLLRTLGPAALEELGGEGAVTAALSELPMLPFAVRSRMQARAADPAVTPQEDLLIHLLASAGQTYASDDAAPPPEWSPGSSFGDDPGSGGGSGASPPQADWSADAAPPQAAPRYSAPPQAAPPHAAPAPEAGAEPPLAPAPGAPRRANGHRARSPREAVATRAARRVSELGRGLRGRRSARPESSAPTQVARALQYGVELPDGTRRLHAWAPGRQDLVVRIGAPGLGWTTSDEAFPEEAVDFTGAGAMLEVTAIIDAGGLAPPQQTTLFLPRVGASSEARLPVDVPDGVGEVRCSVLVHQGARLLQSMEVVGPVAARDAAAGPGLRTVHEVNLVAAPSGLVDRPPPDVGLNLQAGPAGTGVLLQDGEPPTIVHLPGLERLRETLAQVLLDALDSDEVGPEPGGDGQVALLVRLARQGSTLHRSLEHDLARVTAADHVQVIAAEDEYVPLELLYDYGFPAETARLCRGWKEALETGRCTCRPRDGEVRTVCPLGFWGLRKTLERQSSSGRSLPPGSFSLLGQRTATGELRPLSDVLFAASRRVRAVDPDAIRDVEAALRAAPGLTVHPVTNWRAWCRTVRSVHPGLLLALPHNEALRDGLQELHIGRLSRLALGAVTPEHVGGADPPPGPVVLLLGCGTGVAEIPWQSAAAAFRRAGASVVIGCTVPVLGRQVSRLSQLLVAELERTGDQGQTLGETMLGVRRRLLLEGHSVAMALIAFGDADWRLPARAA